MIVPEEGTRVSVQIMMKGPRMKANDFCTEIKIKVLLEGFL